MRVLQLPQIGNLYTCNVYLVLGAWNRLSDVNTLVDVGRDPSVIRSIEAAPTGVGKRKVDRVVLTHCHYDHAELLPQIVREYGPEVFAFSPAIEGRTSPLSDGESLTMGDEEFEVMEIHGHTEDSVCLFNGRSGTLFSGDAPIFVNSGGGDHAPAFLAAMERLCSRDVRVIYPGHGQPLTTGCNERLASSLGWIRESLKEQQTNREVLTR